MNFNSHSDLAGSHAFLSASNYHWINYDDDRLIERFSTWQAAARGTALHDLAHKAINLGVKFASPGKTLTMYVNDAIGFDMATEQTLFYSYNCFGTADAISFKRNKLRIHDLKTGATPTSMKQLMVYAALFCLEYQQKPGTIKMELRLYKSDNIEVYVPATEEIAYIMDKIIMFDKRIDQLKAGVL